MTFPPSEIEFVAWPKIARLNRDIVVTEKIDGTNAAVFISEPFQFGEHVDGVPPRSTLAFGEDSEDDGLPEIEYVVAAQSRSRIISPDVDNFGFAQWVWENADALARTLGPGRHFGEWWGSGIQRGYGLQKGEKRFSLFNTTRWEKVDFSLMLPQLSVVPVLYSGPFSQDYIIAALERLETRGSKAAPGFMRPEGVVVYHTAANMAFKVTLEKDEQPKGQAA